MLLWCSSGFIGWGHGPASPASGPLQGGHVPQCPVYRAVWNRPLAQPLQPPLPSGGLPACLPPWLAQLLLGHVVTLRKSFFPLFGIRFSFAVSCLHSWQEPLAHGQQVPPSLSPTGGTEPGILSQAWGFLQEPGLVKSEGGENLNIHPILGPSQPLIPSAWGLPSRLCLAGACPAHGISFAEAQPETAGECGASLGERETATFPGWTGLGAARACPPPRCHLLPLLPASQQQAQHSKGSGTCSPGV